MKKLPRHSKTNIGGFTLVELLVVIVILGVLSAVTLALLKPSIFYGRGRDARRQTDLQTVKASLEQYYLDNGRLYPDTDYDGLQTPLSSYLDLFPVDPSGGTYTYVHSVDRKCTQLSATMEVETPSSYELCTGSLACQAANSYCN